MAQDADGTDAEEQEEEEVAMAEIKTNEIDGNPRRFLWFGDNLFLNISQILSVQFFEDGMVIEITMNSLRKWTIPCKSREEFNGTRESIRSALK